MNSIISLTNVTLEKQGKKLLDGVNWTVEPGQTWAILGLNGAGKSTLLRLLMAELWKTSGEVVVLGTHFGQGDIPSLRHRIGVVGSFIAERFPVHMLAEQIVLTGRYKSSILFAQYDEKDLKEAQDMLRSIGSDHLIGRKYLTLSQGERQSLLIARSLMDNPDIIIFDEASSGLDLFAREKLLAQVKRITHLPHHPTLIYVTHHAEEISEDMTHVLLLKEGRVIAQGEKEKILQNHLLSDFYGMPVKVLNLGDNRYYIKAEV